MKLKNFEFKAVAKDLGELEAKLLTLNPIFRGEDHQVDTYFVVPQGRLKLREGNIENALIYYERQDLPGSKYSDVIIYKHISEPSLKEILIKTLRIKAIVDKTRKIYFIGNVKFHFDTVKQLGTFVEVEAIDQDGLTEIEKLREQCNSYFSFLNLDESDYLSKSYSDLLIEKTKGATPKE